MKTFPFFHQVTAAGLLPTGAASASGSPLSSSNPTNVENAGQVILNSVDLSMLNRVMERSDNQNLLSFPPGNSGGPAFNRSGECVGIAFQSLKSDDVENIGYVIPTPVIYHFLTDFERNGQYTGFPALGIQWQRMESPALRQSLGLKKGQKGVLIRRLEPTSFAYSVLKEVSYKIGNQLLRSSYAELSVSVLWLFSCLLASGLHIFVV